MSSPNNDFLAIGINHLSSSYPPKSKLFCNLCSCNLILLDPQTEQWFCTRCNISYYPNKEKVRRANKFSTPGPLTESHGNIIGGKKPLVSMVNDDMDLSPPGDKRKLPKSFEEHEKRGVKITSWEEQVG